MIKEIKVLFVAMVAMMMLTGVASAVGPGSIELTDPINSDNVNAVEITGTDFIANDSFAYNIMDNDGNTVDGSGTVAEDGNISVTGIDVSSLNDSELTATVFEVGPNMAEDTATKDTVTTIGIDMIDTSTNISSQTVTGIMEDGGTTVEVECSTATVGTVTYPTNTTWSVDITGMSEDDNEITATATDWAENTASAGITIFVDTVPPTIGINTVDTPTNVNSQIITGVMGNDCEELEVECQTVTVGSVVMCDITWSVEITGMTEGDNVITATAFDELGNEASAEATIVLDTEAPEAPAITLLDPINLANVVAITITGTGEPDALFWSTITDGVESVVGDGTVAGDGTISVTDIDVSSLVDGELTAYVYLRDAAGNTGSNGIDTATKDTEAPEAPEITLTDPINITNENVVTITGTGEADAGIVYVINDDNAIVAGTGTVASDGSILVTGIDVSSLDDGELFAWVWLVDAAGNEGDECMDSATKDTVAPIAEAGDDQIIVLGDTVQFDSTGSSDESSTITYAWDFGDSIGTSTSAEPSYMYEEYGTYTVTLIVTDDAGNTGTDTMTVTHGIKLNVGWNLVSTPLIPDNTSIEVVLSDVDNAMIVWEYDADTSSWLSYIPGGPGGVLTEIAGGIGYWIGMSGDDTLVIEGSYFEEGPNDMPTYLVYEGWNLIGVHSLDLRLAETYMSSASCDCAHTLHGYQDSAWINIDLYSDYLEPGYGYWAYMTEDGAIAP